MAEKVHQAINSESEYVAAIDQVIALAERNLCIFDPDLKKGDYSTLRRFDLLQQFLKKSRLTRLVIILHDVDYYSAYCPRLVQLQKTYSHAFSLMATATHARSAQNPLVIADSSHYVHRFHVDYPRALVAFHDQEGAKPFFERFQQLQEASAPACPADVLGL